MLKWTKNYLSIFHISLLVDWLIFNCVFQLHRLCRSCHRIVNGDFKKKHLKSEKWLDFVPEYRGRAELIQTSYRGNLASYSMVTYSYFPWTHVTLNSHLHGTIPPFLCMSLWHSGETHGHIFPLHSCGKKWLCPSIFWKVCRRLCKPHF